MKRKFTFLSAALMLLAFLAVPLGMWGQTRDSETITFADLGLENGVQYTDPFGTNISVTFGGGANDGKYYNTGSGIRTYGNGTITITALGNTVTGISTTFSGTTYAPSSTDVWSCNGTTDECTYGVNASWSGSATEIVMTRPTGSGHWRLQSITVTYTGSGTPTETHNLTFSADPTEGGTVSVSNNTTGSIDLEEGATVSITAMPAEVGYAFAGWTVSGEGSSVTDEDEASTYFTMGTENAILTASFTTVTTYTVTYHANVPGITDVVDTYNEGANVTLRPANTFTNEGYTFSEWNTQADGDGDTYEAGEEIESIDEYLELYAVWTEASTPTSSDVTFDATVDKDEDGDLTIVKDGVTFSCTSGALGNGTEYRLYKSSTTTFSVTSGTITQIVFTCTSGNPASGFETQTGWTTNGNNGTWTGSATSVSFVASSKQVRATTIVVTVETSGTPDPTISASDVDIAYNATSGSIEYTINNGVEGGSLTAATESDWLTLPNIFDSPIQFTCSANEAATERTATVTLTYAYGDSQTVTKNVTVTQAGDPNVTQTIADVRAQGTGAVVTRGIVTSCVGTTGYIQDATAAICVYGEELTVGDEIRVSGTLSTFHGLLEITSPEFTVISQGNTINPQLMTVAEVMASTNQGWYIRIENATVTAISEQSTTIAQGDNTIVVYGISGVEIAVDDVISLNGNIGNHDGVQIANPQNVEVQEAAVLTITPATVNIPQTGSVSGSFEVTTNITGMFGGYVYYYAPENLETPIDEPDWYTINYNYDSETLNISYVSTLANNTYEARTVCFKYFAMCDQGLVPSNVVTVTQEGKPLPIITIDPLAYTFNADEHNGTIEVAYENVATEAGLSIYWYEADGETTATYDWIYAEINTENNVAYMIGANDGEARTAYFKVYGLDAYASDVWSGLVTISQEAYVIDYAELPFAYDGNGLGTLPNGLTQEGLTDNYTSSPKMKFDGTGDWLLLHFNERPGTLTFNIKGNGFSDGTFTVQTSEDGVTFDELETYTDLGSTQNEEFDNLDENVRYIKWIYTEKSSGNVALGNIGLTKYIEPVVVASITVDPDEVSVDADEHDGTLALTYENFEIESFEDFVIQYYDAEGEEINDPTWIVVTTAEDGDDLLVSYYMEENNEDEARTAYFKVWALDDDDELVYSNLVTVTQAAPVAPFTGATYTLATTIESGRRYIITNGSDRAMGGQNTNNRAAKEIVIVENVAQVDSDEVVEFVINGPDANGFYTIYDANVPGYLYAAGGTSNNHLKTETFCNNKGQWTITFEDNAASIVANVSGRNKMQYNSSSNIFSCYTGGQDPVYLYLKDEEEPTYTFYKDIKGYTGNGGYYLIASPVAEDVTPSEENGIINGTIGENNNTYDLYWFDQTQEDEWQNYEAAQFDLVNGMGYLYANSEDVTLNFNGAPSTNGAVSLVKDDAADWAGWNLVGNPFGYVAYITKNYYRMNEDGDELVLDQGGINPMEGVFVIADENDEEMTFYPTQPLTMNNNIVVNVTNSNKVVDRAVVSFGEGGMLPKFQLNPNHTKVYIPQGENDYAVVRSAAQGEMPVSFKASKNGTYTLSINAENVEMSYLHLIDNMTGADVDLLATPNYSFEASTTDYASRFRLVFNANTVNENSNESFAFFNGSEWVISNMGEATLQVVDMLGRIVSSETVNGNATMSTANLGAGVYVMRLVNGENVMTQKIVVK